MCYTRTVTEQYKCSAPEALFGEWEDVPQELRDKIPRIRGLPCEGGGVPGAWCARGCPWEMPAVTLSDEMEKPLDTLPESGILRMLPHNPIGKET